MDFWAPSPTVRASGDTGSEGWRFRAPAGRRRAQVLCSQADAGSLSDATVLKVFSACAAPRQLQLLRHRRSRPACETRCAAGPPGLRGFASARVRARPDALRTWAEPQKQLAHVWWNASCASCCACACTICLSPYPSPRPQENFTCKRPVGRFRRPSLHTTPTAIVLDALSACLTRGPGARSAGDPSRQPTLPSLSPC